MTYPVIPLIIYLVPLGLCGCWLLYRAFALGRESNRMAVNYKPRIHGADYIEHCRAKFDYFKLLCVANLLVWSMFSAVAILIYFGVKNGAS